MVASEHSINAKLLYGLLLNRTMLSQKNGWVSDEGHVYVIYTIKQMANDLNRSERTVQAALSELEDAGLLMRRRQGFKKANLLYLLLPDDVQFIAGHNTQEIAGHDRGVRPFLSDKFDITKHPKYKFLSDSDKRNAFDIEKYLQHKLVIKPTDTFDLYDMGEIEAD